MSKECVKTKFSTKEHAEHALRKIAKENPHGKRPTRAYECTLCGTWHLTSRDDITVIYEEREALKKQVTELKHEIYLLNYEKTLMSKQERNEIKREELYLQLRQQQQAAQKTNKKLRETNNELCTKILQLQTEIEKLKNGNI